MRMLMAARSLMRLGIALAAIAAFVLGAFWVLGTLSPHLDRSFHVVSVLVLGVVALFLLPLFRWGAGVPDSEPF